MIGQRFGPPLKSKNIRMLGQKSGKREVNQSIGWSFLGGSITISKLNIGSNNLSRKSSAVYASFSGAFTLGTTVVLPFYTLMLVTPQAEFVGPSELVRFLTKIFHPNVYFKRMSHNSSPKQIKVADPSV